MSAATTQYVKAIIPVLGLRLHQVAELTDSPYLRLCIERGWLEKVTKAEAKALGAAGAPAVVDPDIAK